MEHVNLLQNMQMSRFLSVFELVHYLQHKKWKYLLVLNAFELFRVIRLQLT